MGIRYSDFQTNRNTYHNIREEGSFNIDYTIWVFLCIARSLDFNAQNAPLANKHAIM